MIYDTSATTIDEQIVRLLGRGMIIQDVQAAKEFHGTIQSTKGAYPSPSFTHLHTSVQSSALDVYSGF